MNLHFWFFAFASCWVLDSTYEPPCLVYVPGMAPSSSYMLGKYSTTLSISLAQETKLYHSRVGQEAWNLNELSCFQRHKCYEWGRLSSLLGFRSRRCSILRRNETAEQLTPWWILIGWDTWSNVSAWDGFRTEAKKIVRVKLFSDIYLTLLRLTWSFHL